MSFLNDALKVDPWSVRTVSAFCCLVAPGCLITVILRSALGAPSWIPLAIGHGALLMSWVASWLTATVDNFSTNPG